MLAVLRSTCPFPTIDSEGSLRDGLNIAQPKRCHKCGNRSCRQQLEGSHAPLEHHVCEFGYSLIRLQTQYGPLLVNGVFVPFHNHKMDAPTRKAHRSQKVTWEQANLYAGLLESAQQHIGVDIAERVNEAAAGLHDIRTAVNVILRNAEAIVSALPGYDDYQRIEGADPPLKALLKSVNLLSSRLNFVSILSNPDAAKYGQPRPTPVYRVFDRFVHLFEQEAARKKVRIRMDGPSFAMPRLHDSFDTIPLVLLDNAVKYATPQTEIGVKVNDTGDPSAPCIATVESIGPLISADHQEAIFQRGFRAPQAKEIASSGSGLGLYIARIVAEANRCTIHYTGRRFNAGAEGGSNTFTVRVGAL